MWDWDGLSGNENLPWSESYILKYEDKWDWENLSRNNAIPWNEHLIEKYFDKWDWDALSRNDFLPWSVALIKKYSDKWGWFDLGQGLGESMPNFWNKVFNPIVNDQLILETLSRLKKLDISTETVYDFNIEDIGEAFKNSKPAQRLRKLIAKLNLKK